MDLDCLETFLVVARTGSFTEAAGLRHLTQPAVSRQVQRLEADLGVRLFRVDGRGVRLTSHGQLLREEGARLLGHVRSVREMLEDVRELRRGELRIGASSTPGTYVLPPVLASFRNAHPGVVLHVELSNSRTIENRIVGGDLELGFVGERIDTPRTTSEPFASDEVCLVAVPGHRLAARRAVPLADILAERYIAREEGSATRRLVEAGLARAGSAWKAYLELGSGEAVKHAVAAGLGIGAVSRAGVAWELAAGRLGEVRVRDMTLARQLFVLHRSNAPLSAAASVFLAMMRGARPSPPQRP